MFDVTAGHEGYRLVSGDALEGAQVVDGRALDLAPCVESALSDEQVLAQAWMELAAAEAAGVRVLGQRETVVDERGELSDVDDVLAVFEAQRPALPGDQLEVRRERRVVRRTLRALGGAA